MQLAIEYMHLKKRQDNYSNLKVLEYFLAKKINNVHSIKL
jgi:hypothetical protein